MKIRYPLIAAALTAGVLVAYGTGSLPTATPGSASPTASAAVQAVQSAIRPAAAAESADVLAVVNDVPITRAQLEAYTQERAMHAPTTGSPDEREQILAEMINLELVVQDALRLGLDKQSDVAAELENQRRGVLAGAAVRYQVESNPVSAEELRREYDARMAELSLQEYKARHILVETEEEARELIAALDDGGDFVALADEKSLDEHAEGGSLGWFGPGQMVQPFSDAVAAMDAGTYSKAPVQTDFGWHVILLEDTRDVPPPPFEELEDRVRSFMQNQHINEYISKLRADARVEVKQ